MREGGVEEGALDALGVARSELAPGERLIWADRPDPARSTRRSWPVVLFGLVFAGFATLFTLRGWAAGGPVGVLGLPFVAIGAGIALSPLWRQRSRRRTVYAITDRRLLIIRAGTVRRVRSFTPGDIQDLDRRERPDGTGDLIFGHETLIRDDLRLRRDGPPHYRSRRHALGFFGIPEVRRVEAAVQALRDGRDPGQALG